MARTMAGLPDGTRVSDHISLGVVTKAFPLPLIRRILAETERTSQRERELPARDPDTLSFVHAVRVLRRTLPRAAALPP